MGEDGKRRKVKPGDGHPLERFRWWQPFSRALFHLRLPEDDGSRHTWSIDVRLWGDSDGEVRAKLYRDGTNTAISKLPAAFPVPGGAIEVVTSTYGLRRCHFVGDDGSDRQLSPDPRSAEGRRAWLDREHRGLSRALSITSVSILLISLVLGLPQLLELVTSIDWIADRVGTFTSPIHLPSAVNITLIVASILASTERALRLRYHWLLDGGLFDGED